MAVSDGDGGAAVSAAVEAADGGEDPVGGTIELALRVVSGADIEVKHGLRRSTETVQGLPERDNTNVFSVLSRTANGPTYGGVNGRLTASTRTKTAGTDMRAPGTLAGRGAQ